MELACGLRLEGEVELVLSAELETLLSERVVPLARAAVALGEIGGDGGDLVGDDAVLRVLLVGQAEVLLVRDFISRTSRCQLADHCQVDRRGDIEAVRSLVIRDRCGTAQSCGLSQTPSQDRRTYRFIG